MRRDQGGGGQAEEELGRGGGGVEGVRAEPTSLALQMMYSFIRH